ncbi:hypothetical protein [Nonomuraea phyllanthi]|uniref:hypothetical protein n=1 Tax=Nonomuraea phyllanthi TaxID=2219224 RepID=UPI00129320E7|nr:hypothetical protein [Nonomuraea phyllanthi]
MVDLVEWALPLVAELVEMPSPRVIRLNLACGSAWAYRTVIMSGVESAMRISR